MVSHRKSKPIRKTALTASKSALDGLLIGLADAARLIGKSETHVLSLVSEGFLKRAGRGQYQPRDVAQAALKFRESDDRRTSHTEERRRLEAAKARSQELRVAREEHSLIEMVEVEAAVSHIFGIYRYELSGVAAASTRDLVVRASIDKHLSAAIDRCRKRFEEASDDLRSGRDLDLDSKVAEA